MKNKRLVVIGLLEIDFGIFLAVSALLPRAGSFSWSGPLSRYVNARQNWDIAWGVLAASIILSAGALLLMEGLGVFAKRDKTIEPAPRCD